MSLSISAYRQAGDTIEDADVDEDANIEISKLGTRTLAHSIPGPAFRGVGTGVVPSGRGVYGSIKLPDTNTGNIYASIPLPDEYDSGNIVIRVWWSTPATAGNVKFVVNIKSTTKDGTTALEETQNITDAADATTNDLNNATATFAAADFTKGDFIGINITRDPADAADTIADEVELYAVVLEFTGRG